MGLELRLEDRAQTKCRRQPLRMRSHARLQLGRHRMESPPCPSHTALHMTSLCGRETRARGHPTRAIFAQDRGRSSPASCRSRALEELPRPVVACRRSVLRVLSCFPDVLVLEQLTKRRHGGDSQLPEDSLPSGAPSARTRAAMLVGCGAAAFFDDPRGRRVGVFSAG